ncbi:hypothetical protein AVEN_140216-1 [Araneus ventricosus]|uniref:Uncharacterized protein n=1 Tax=Araneus ventricosus TaxID=182803 RepID=A0A4Y2I766_ARAVE|nr:hypothetical protein AVEN_140216-1 [Araneus ventricosus]
MMLFKSVGLFYVHRFPPTKYQRLLSLAKKHCLCATSSHLNNTVNQMVKFHHKNYSPFQGIILFCPVMLQFLNGRRYIYMKTTKFKMALNGTTVLEISGNVVAAIYVYSENIAFQASKAA